MIGSQVLKLVTLVGLWLLVDTEADMPPISSYQLKADTEADMQAMMDSLEAELQGNKAHVEVQQVPSAFPSMLSAKSLVVVLVCVLIGAYAFVRRAREPLEDDFPEPDSMPTPPSGIQWEHKAVVRKRKGAGKGKGKKEWHPFPADINEKIEEAYSKKDFLARYSIESVGEFYTIFQFTKSKSHFTQVRKDLDMEKLRLVRRCNDGAETKLEEVIPPTFMEKVAGKAAELKDAEMVKKVVDTLKKDALPKVKEWALEKAKDPKVQEKALEKAKELYEWILAK